MSDDNQNDDFEPDDEMKDMAREVAEHFNDFATALESMFDGRVHIAAALHFPHDGKCTGVDVVSNIDNDAKVAAFFIDALRKLQMPAKKITLDPREDDQSPPEPGPSIH